MQKFILLLLAYLSLGQLTAQQTVDVTIYGKITDSQTGDPIAFATVGWKGNPQGTVSRFDGTYRLPGLPAKKGVLEVNFVGYEPYTQSVDLTLADSVRVDVQLKTSAKELKEVTVVTTGNKMYMTRSAGKMNAVGRGATAPMAAYGYSAAPAYQWADVAELPDLGEPAADTVGNFDYRNVLKNPFSTFSIDVDDGSYSLMRKSVKAGNLPDKDEVRTEEFVNYFDYHYPLPKSQETPFNVYTEMSNCPWNPAHKLLHLGIQGYDVVQTDLPASNLVFLIDVSGSMMSADKLPLVQKAFNYMVDELRAEDVVSIVVYAGNSGLVLPPTHGNEKSKIKEAINKLQAGGSTAGGAGIELAYKTAKENFMPNGNNRVILATDGDFNVGISDDAGLIKLIEQKREDGIFLSVVGCGSGNYQDKKMEQLADHGNGYYGYIDDEAEAKRIFAKQMGATILTIAKDVKLQVEFNPAWVKEYKLVGYENRILKDEEFKDDKKDAGELGGGSSVTALYEVVLYDAPNLNASIEKNAKLDYATFGERDIMALNIRYKDPKGTQSKLITKMLQDNSVTPDKTSDDFRFSAAVAMTGMFLKDAKNKGNTTLDMAYALAVAAKGEDKDGYRNEFCELLKKMKNQKPAAERKTSPDNQ